MHSLLTKQVPLLEQVPESLKMELGRWNIIGGYNKIILMSSFKEGIDEVIKQIYWLENSGWGIWGLYLKLLDTFSL